MNDLIKRLHEHYCKATGLQVELTMQKIYAWESWLTHGWTEQDIDGAVHCAHQRTRDRTGFFRLVGFRWFIERPDYFDELRSEGKALKRRPVVDANRASALMATGRSPEPRQTEARPMRDLIAENKALQELRALKNSL